MRDGIIMKLEFQLTRVVVLVGREIIACINASDWTTNVVNSSAFIAAESDLARMLISGEKQGEHTEEQKGRARRRIRK